jgi:hypothetical protein
MTCDEAQELITGLVDQELRDPEVSLLETHLNECARCRLVLAEERALKTKIRAIGDTVRAPARLRNRILSDQRIFPKAIRSRTSPLQSLWPTSHVPGRALLAAVVLIVACTIFFRGDYMTRPVALAALDTYESFINGGLPVIKAQHAEEINEQLIRAVDGKFHPMGYDLGAMNLQPVAGAVREIRGRKILVAIYQGPGGSLLCYTFLGTETDTPPNAARFFDSTKKINFYAFSRGGVNAVLHREKDVICILASEMPMEKLLGLAKSGTNPS